MNKRVIFIVLDSVGIGELPDAEQYGDKGSSTLANIASQTGGLNIPHLQRLGLGNIATIQGVPPVSEPEANFGRMQERSPGKDTTTGHWEIAGVILDKPFPTFPKSFPDEIIKPFEKAIGRGVLGNVVASGTEIINELGEEHIKTGKPIVYTSADSVFQVAAHEEIIPLDEQIAICHKAREILIGKFEVARVIARPFLGKPGSFYRTTNRKDLAIQPPIKIFLEYITEKDIPVFAVGKINDIYAGRGISEYIKTKGNLDGIDKTLDYMDKEDKGLIMTNLVDFDMLYGHRNNVLGYKKAIEEFDSRLPEILDRIREDDLLIITADHGCDPTTPSTDHSREYVPLLAYGKNLRRGINLGVRQSFADAGATVTDYLGVGSIQNGHSFYKQIKREE